MPHPKADVSLRTPADGAKVLAATLDGFTEGQYDLDAVRTITELVRVWLDCQR
jgi:hypothetical protein